MVAIVMQRMARLAAGFAGLVFLAMGLAFLLAPGQIMGRFGVFPTSNAGYSTLRGDNGGLLIAAGIFALAGAWNAKARGVMVSAFLIGLVAFGRMVSLLFDGYASDTVQALVVELVMIAALLGAALVFRNATGLSPLRYFWLAPLLLGVAAFAFQRPLGLAIAKAAAERAFGEPLISTLPDGLHAGLCGSGSPLPDATRAGPCVFVIAGQRLYIVDAGDGSTRKLSLMGLPPGQIEAVLLTHFHSDHIGGLGEMMLQRWAGGSHRDPTPVIGPQGVDSLVEGFNQAYALDKKYRVSHHGEATVPPSGSGGVARPFTLTEGSDAGQVVIDRDGLIVTAFPVPHTPVFPAVGYRFDYKGRSVVISGDTAPSQTLAKYAKGADLLFHEGLQTALVSILQESAARHGRTGTAKILGDIPPYHTTPEDAARVAQQAGVRQLVFYHIIPPLPSPFLNAAFLGDAGKIFSGPIKVGKDGLMVSLLPGSGGAISMRELL